MILDFLISAGNWFAEHVLEFCSTAAAVVSSLGVFAVARAQSKQAEAEKQNQKKNTWHKEMLSTEKIEVHVTDVATVLQDNTLSCQGQCSALNKKMLDFFYNVVNYVSFFDINQYENLKGGIMAAMDNVMFSLALSTEPLSTEDVEKILDVYRMKLTYHFYQIDIDQA